MNKRSAAVLLPLTSLPDQAPLGVMGKEAFHFIDQLSAAGIEYWQMLPVHLFDQYGCPYASPAAFGGNPLLLGIESIDHKMPHSPHDINFDELYRVKLPELKEWALARLKNNPEQALLEIESLKNKYSWLHDLAIFLTLREELGDYWTKWPQAFRSFETAEKEVLHSPKRKESYLAQLVLQVEFHQRWQELKNYAHNKGVKLIGDIPIFVSAESFDTWRWRSLFKVDQESGDPKVITGAPPDDYSTDGQLWGTVNYAWDDPSASNSIINWWLKRLEYSLDLFDLIRIDHFIGVYHVWESPSQEETAASGKWERGDGDKLLAAIKERFPHMPFIAEDLGDLTQEVSDLRDKYELPTMKVFQFSVNDNATNEHLPSQVIEDCCYYSGTHDNNTLMGWLHENMASESFLKNFHQRFGTLLTPENEEEVRQIVIKEVALSKAKLVVIPLQDVFALDESTRINVPGTSSGNWRWRITPDQWNPLQWEGFIETLSLSGRLKKNRNRELQSP